MFWTCDYEDCKRRATWIVRDANGNLAGCNSHMGRILDKAQASYQAIESEAVLWTFEVWPAREGTSMQVR
jgi:hypothetical protein